MQRTSLLFLILIVCISSCRKDSNTYDPTTLIPDPQISYENSFRGVVLDRDGTIIPNTLIKIGASETTSDINGTFSFDDIVVSGNGVLVSAQHPDHFIGSSFINSPRGHKDYTEVVLTEKGSPIQFQSSMGGESALPHGGSLRIPESSAVYANGSTYDGMVNLYAHWIDPMSEELVDLMPGALLGVDDANEEVVLATYGMIQFEMESNDGQPLYLVPDKPAQIMMPIPAEIIDSAPEDIPLWYFDVGRGRWILKGMSNKVGGFFSGVISSPGIWNCDIPFEGVDLSMNIKNQDSTAGKFIRVTMENQDRTFSNGGFSNSEGFFSGVIPKDVPIKLTITDICGEELYSEDIGAFGVDTQLPDICLDEVVERFLIKIDGTLMSCQGSPVGNGQINVVYSNGLTIFPTANDGTFDTELYFNCATFPDIYITGYDLITEKTTSTINITTDDDYHLGDIFTCEDPEDFFTITVDGATQTLTPTEFYFSRDTGATNVNLTAITMGGFAAIYLKGYDGLGTYNSNNLRSRFFVQNQSINIPTYPNLNGVTPSITITITEDDGQFIEGSVSGIVQDSLLNDHAISAVFKIRAQQ